MNTAENNKLIAEFMGWVYEDDTPSVELPPYHKSWDWLMPVVGKIRDIYIPHEIDKNVTLDFYSIRDCIPEIHHTYPSVVEFFTQYNDYYDNYYRELGKSF